MYSDKIYKKISSWNTFYIIFGILSSLMGAYGLYGNLTWKSTYEKYKDMGVLDGVSMENYKPNIFNVVISAIVLVITIYTIVLAIKNRKNIRDKIQLNILPYIITLILQVYSIITAVITMIFTKGITGDISANLENVEGAGGFFAITMIVTYLMMAIMYTLGILPSVRIIMLNKKTKNIIEEKEINSNDDEEE